MEIIFGWRWLLIFPLIEWRMSRPVFWTQILAIYHLFEVYQKKILLLKKNRKLVLCLQLKLGFEPLIF